MKNKNARVLKTIALTGVLTALYCVLAALMKVPFIGNIMLDLGYIALACACVALGPLGAFVGAVGCGLESLLFSAYGLSYSWMAANLIIGLGCGIVFRKTKKLWIRIVAIWVFCAIGVLITKTAMECALYNIPLLVKLPKNAIAFAVDAATMTIGLLITRKIKFLKNK